MLSNDCSIRFLSRFLFRVKTKNMFILFLDHCEDGKEFREISSAHVEKLGPSNPPSSANGYGDCSASFVLRVISYYKKSCRSGGE